jgi:putative CocE/NonD family hydrolase
MNDVQIDRDLVVVLADGTRLSGDLYRPANAPPGPVLVSFYPYRKDDIIGSLFEGCRIRLCERGYASVFFDIAGTGASEGSFEPFDVRSEGQAYVESIDWIARQEWCNGDVGAWGVSYGGLTALAVAALRPPGLRAIVAVYSSTDPYAHSISYGGCTTMLGRYAWAAHMVALGLCPPTHQDSGGQWRRTWTDRLRRFAAGQPPAVTWQEHLERDEYWDDRQLDCTAIEVPTMIIGGWADGFKGAMLRAYADVKGPKKLVMGPWLHVLPHLCDIEPWDWVTAMADWWDSHLQAGAAAESASVAEPAPEDPVLFYAENEGWRTGSQWPPAGVTQREMFLAGYRLDAAAPPQPGGRDYRCDPTVGVDGGMYDPFGTGNGRPEEQSSDDARSLTFTSDPLDESLLIAGAPEVELFVTRRCADEVRLSARLCQVSPDGHSTLITSGWCLIPAGQHPTGPDATGAQLATVTMGPAAFTLEPGTRLRLSVACADFPRIWPSPTNPDVTVSFGADTASVLRLPVARAADRTDSPATIPLAPPEPDEGWVTDGGPVYGFSRDKVAEEVAVTFGAWERLVAPSGAELKMEEQFTARVKADRPDGAALVATIDVGLRMPAGERVDISVRSRSSRTASVVEASVLMDGASLLRQSWSGDGSAGQTGSSSSD